jgi:hypothetical protein
MKLDVSQSEKMLNYRKFISLFDVNWNPVVRKNKTRKIPVMISPEVWEESGFVEMENMTVPPGAYHCEIQLEDNASNSIGVYKGPIIVPDYSQEQLMLSDVILSGPVSRMERYTYYMKGDVTYDPHMFAAYREGETVGIYVEVYNLLFDTSDRTSFEVTWYLRTADEGDSGTEIVQSSLEYSGKSRDDKIFFNLELKDIELDDYEMVIRVKDLISDMATRKIIKISVR